MLLDSAAWSASWRGGQAALACCAVLRTVLQARAAQRLALPAGQKQRQCPAMPCNQPPSAQRVPHNGAQDVLLRRLGLLGRKQGARIIVHMAVAGEAAAFRAVEAFVAGAPIDVLPVLTSDIFGSSRAT